MIKKNGFRFNEIIKGSFMYFFISERQIRVDRKLTKALENRNVKQITG